MGVQGVPAVMEVIVEASAVALYVDTLGCYMLVQMGAPRMGGLILWLCSDRQV
jgi:hypothetical protein